jgi:hypothetical protein
MRGFPPYSYDEYKALLESSAMTYDESKVASRSVNHHTIVSDDEESEVEQSEFSIHVTKGKMPGSSMNKETWNSLDKEEQAIWDKLKDSSKRKILQYAKDRAGKKEKEVKINMVEVTDTESPPSSEEPDDPQDNQEKTEDTEETFQMSSSLLTYHAVLHLRYIGYTGRISTRSTYPGAPVQIPICIYFESS